jgi:hypothetical protein
MPNGYDRAYIELTIACAAYRERFGTWPTSAFLDPMTLKNLADLFDYPGFHELAQRLRLNTDLEEVAFYALGEAGSLHRREVKNVKELVLGGYIEDARSWLGVKPREPRNDEH